LAGGGALAFVGATIAGDLVGGGRSAVLNRYLNMVEPRIIKTAERLGGQADGRRDQVGIEPRRVRGGGDLDEVAAGGALPPPPRPPPAAPARRPPPHPPPRRGGGVRPGRGAGPAGG